jgi:competence protein ComEC
MRRESAPLFPVALLFAAGVALGLNLPAAGFLYLAAGLSGLVLWKFLPGPRVSFAALAGAIFFAGAYHASHQEKPRSVHDARALPETKFSETARWRGRIASPPEARSSTRSRERSDFVLRLSHWNGGGGWQPAEGKVQVRLYGAASPPYFYGDTLEVAGGLSEPPAPRNPGQFDYRAWLRIQRIHYQLQAPVEKVHRTKIHSASHPVAACLRARDWAYRHLRIGLEDDPAATALLAGMLFGYKSEIPPELESAFRATGTYHIFSVSGQNVGVLLLVGVFFLRLVGLLQWRWGWVLAPLLAGYCVLSGLQPSCIRALILVLLILAAWRLCRPIAFLNLWSVALLGLLAFDPLILKNAGFLLSFTVVLALILITPPLFHFWYRPFNPDPFLPARLVSPARRFADRAVRAFLGVAAGSVAAWIGSAPLLLVFFHQISPVALVANLVVVPLASLVVIIGTLSLATACAGAGITSALNNANWLVLKALTSCVVHLAGIPGASIYVPDGRVLFPPAHPEFIVAETGSTCTALVRYRAGRWLLNAGRPEDFQYVVDPMRQFYGINALDGVWLTEFSERCAGAAPLLSRTLPVRQWWLGAAPGRSPLLRRWRQDENTRLPFQALKAGDELVLGSDFSVQVLSPASETAGQRAEDQALVLLFRHHNHVLLWAAAIGFGRETQLLRDFPDLRADVLIQGYHRSEANLSDAWLERLRPQHVIRPAPDFYSLQRIRDLPRFQDEFASSKIWRQEKTGAVTVILGEHGIDVRPFRSE